MTVWITAALLVGEIARRKARSSKTWVVVSPVFGRLLAILLVIALPISALAGHLRVPARPSAYKPQI